MTRTFVNPAIAPLFPHGRRSIRLPNYDYTNPGQYFVTTNINEWRHLLGRTVNGSLQLTEAGQMVEEQWKSLTTSFDCLSLENFVVMPNHFHGIVVINAPNEERTSLGDVIGAFKSLTTVLYGHGVRTQGWPKYNRRLWHRNYYESIILSDDACSRVTKYIERNPAIWESRFGHPAKTRRQPGTESEVVESALLCDMKGLL